MGSIGIREWPFWSLPAPVRGYVVLVALAALAAAGTTVDLVPVTRQSLVWFAVLSAAAVAHLEVTRRIERMREIAAEGTPHAHLQSIWIFAALLLLPPPLVVAVIVISYGHAWLRVYRRRTLLHRKVFSAATVVLGCWCAGAAIIAVHPDRTGSFVSRLDGPFGLVALVAAALAYWLVNLGLVIAAIIFTNPSRSGRAAFGHLSDQLIIGASVGLGTAIAVMMSVQPWLTPVLVLTALALNLGLLLPQFAAASRTDQKTGLLNATFWHELAGKELLRARRLRSTIGLLMIDLDHFKSINDRHGHPAGDQVLRAVGTALRNEARADDLVGRFGGEEFVVLLPGVDTATLGDVAGRICQRIRQLEVNVETDQEPVVVRELTASIGAALYPQMAATLEELLWAADNALFAAKDAGRDQVRMVRSVPLR
ncbi:MAG TPA: GGDEF domain-containing protein [Pseudonocardiaceae bacterium]|nr:GGDEF domain-containing protein [Pseudonocardiaceae bacterium]